jgi:hypothetical protein
LLVGAVSVVIDFGGLNVGGPRVTSSPLGFVLDGPRGPDRVVTFPAH